MSNKPVYYSPLVRTLDFPVEAAVALSDSSQKNSYFQIYNGGVDNEFE